MALHRMSTRMKHKKVAAEAAAKSKAARAAAAVSAAQDNGGRQLLEVNSRTGASLHPERFPAPLWRDPIFDGAADPTVVWDERRREWRIFYTQRRAKGSEELPGVSWCYGTAIGMATSSDGGASWAYRGTAR